MLGSSLKLSSNGLKLRAMSEFCIARSFPPASCQADPSVEMNPSNRRELTMRHVIWLAVLASFTQVMPIAHAQSDSGTKGGT